MIRRITGAEESSGERRSVVKKEEIRGEERGEQSRAEERRHNVIWSLSDLLDKMVRINRMSEKSILFSSQLPVIYVSPVLEYPPHSTH